MEGESWRGQRGEGNMGEESGRIYHGGIVEDESWESNDGFVITEALWRRNRREAILESSRGLKQEESWRRQILQEEASKRNVGRRILERESSKSSPGAVRKRTWSKSVRKGIMFWSTGAPRGCQEAHTRHPGGTQAAPRRHPRLQRALGEEKLIEVCSQMQKFFLFFNFAMRL